MVGWMMQMRAIRWAVWLAVFPLALLHAVIEWVPGSVQATPTKYQVNIRRVSFRNQAGEWITYIDQLFPMDIASANPGAAIGTLGRGNNIPPGTYDAMMFHIGSEFTINASVADVGNGFAAYTDGSSAGSVSVSDFGSIPTAVVTAGTPTPTDRVLQMPISSTSQETLETQHMFFETIDGQVYMKGIMDFGGRSFTISPTNHKMPTIRMDFDVTHAVDFILIQNFGINSVVAVTPAGPGLSLYLDGVLVFQMGR